MATQQILKQGQSYTDPAGRTGTVGWDTQTGLKLNPGQFTVTLPNNLNSADASRVGATSDIVTPQLTPNSGATGSIDAISAITAANKTASAEEVKNTNEIAKLQADQATKKSGIQSIFDKLRGKRAEKNELYEDTGVDTARKEVDELTSQIEAETLAARRKVEDIRANFRGTTGGADAEIALVNRRSLSKLADLSIVQNASLRRYSTLKDIADRQIEAETEDLRLELDGLKFFYEDNKEELSKKEDREWQETIKAKDRAYNETVDAKKALSDTKIELLKSASSQSASTSVLQAIQNATTPEQAISAAGKYSGDILDRLYKQKQIDKLTADIEADGKDELLTIDEAAKLGVPYGTTKAEAISSIKGSSGKPAPLNPVQQNALTSAEQLLEALNSNFGGLDRFSIPRGNAPIGNIRGALPQLMAGQAGADFIINFDNLKSLLSLDNVKLLKGQGAVSDAERRLLADGSTKLNRRQSPAEFKKTLEDIVRVFRKASPEYQFVEELTGGSSGLSADAYANSVMNQ